MTPIGGYTKLSSPILELLSTLLIIVNAVIMLYASLEAYRAYRCKTGSWIDLMISLISLIWSSFYVYMLLTDAENSAIVIQLFIRPLNTVTFMLFLTLIRFSGIGKTNGKC